MEVSWKCREVTTVMWWVHHVAGLSAELFSPALCDFCARMLTNAPETRPLPAALQRHDFLGAHHDYLVSDARTRGTG